jgi:hypothetical protein
MKKAYLIASFLVIVVLGLIFGQGLFQLFSYLRPLLSVTGWIIVLLSILIIFLIYSTTAIRRLHERVVADLDAVHGLSSSRLKELSEVYGRMYQLNRQFSEVERPAPEALSHLAERLRKALWACYGLAGTEKFTEGGKFYSVTVPEDESKHSEWVYNTYLRLGDLIKEESPKQERLLPPHIPDAAFRD